MVANRKDTLAGRNMWDEFIALRDRQRKETHGAMQVVKEKDLPLETNQMGQMEAWLNDLRVASELMKKTAATKAARRAAPAPRTVRAPRRTRTTAPA